MISKAVKDLVSYGLKTGLLKEEDAVYARNQILDVLRINEYEEPRVTISPSAVSQERTITARSILTSFSVPPDRS